MKSDVPIDPGLAKSILDFLPMGVYVLNKDRKVQWANERLLKRVRKGRSDQKREEYCYKEIFKREEPCSECPALKTIETGRMEHVEISGVYGGEVRHYLIIAAPLGQGKGRETLIIETVQDITSWKRAQENLRSLNDFNSAIIENAPVAIFTVDKSGKFMSVNPALAKLSGLGTDAERKLLGFNWLENPFTVRSGLADHIKRGLAGEAFELQDFPFVTYRGEGNYLHFRGVPLLGKEGNVEGLLCIIEDATEKVKTRIRSIQDAKMSVLGRLMTGIAHELNNPLATVAANSELAYELFQNMKGGTLREDEIKELREYLDVIQDQAFRCKNIINDMIDLTRKDGFETQEIDLANCLSGLLSLMNFRKLKIRVVNSISGELPHVAGDVNAVKQCFMNILQNAADAVEDREDGVIWLRAYPAGKTVRVEIEDNGTGIPEGIMDKLFEPFFSTKSAGKGVGLGLTLCYDFLKRMGGNIEVESTVNRGSIFRVILPRCEGEQMVDDL